MRFSTAHSSMFAFAIPITHLSGTRVWTCSLISGLLCIFSLLKKQHITSAAPMMIVSFSPSTHLVRPMYVPSPHICIVRVILHTSLSYELIDVPTNFCSLVHNFLPRRPARRRHSDHIHAAVHAIRLKCLSVIIRNQSGILWPSVLPLCKYYLHVLSL